MTDLEKAEMYAKFSRGYHPLDGSGFKVRVDAFLNGLSSGRAESEKMIAELGNAVGYCATSDETHDGCKSCAKTLTALHRWRKKQE